MKRVILLLAIALIGVSQELWAQKAAIKTNLFSDVFLNVNLGMEVGLAPKWTIDFTGELNAWTLSHNRRWKHWVLQPEVRYWFAIVSPDISLVHIYMGGSITSEDLTDVPIS